MRSWELGGKGMRGEGSERTRKAAPRGKIVESLPRGAVGDCFLEELDALPC